MATPYTWHPGTSGVTNPVWPLPLLIAPDELLSSWIIRLALEHGCDPLTLTGMLWPNWRIWTMDLDRMVTREHLVLLAQKTGQAVESIFAASLRSICSNLGGPSENSDVTAPWILALGSRNRQRHGGHQYCGFCLAEDPAPFYRLQWRFAWHTVCTKHQVLLNDRCFACRSSVQPHRLTMRHRDVSCCASCDRPLSDALHLRGNAQASKFQIRADSVACMDRGTYGEFELSSHDWFRLAHYFVMLLRAGTRQPDSRLSSCLQGLDPASALLQPTLTGLAIEMLPPNERALLLSCVETIIEAGPNVLKNAITAAGLTAATMRQDWSEPPFPINVLVKDFPRQIKNRRRGRVGLQRPKSPEEVSRMWARLCRKHHG